MKTKLNIAGWSLAALLVMLVWSGCGGSGGGGPVSVTLTANPQIVQTGDPTTLQWTSQGANRVQSSNFNATQITGSRQVMPSAATTYSITVSNGHQNASASVLVTPENMPPAPQPGATINDLFFVQTLNYYNLYTLSSVSSPPFAPQFEMTDNQFPVPVSYQTLATPPTNFDLQLQSEQDFTMWWQADHRVAIISGVPMTSARIKVELVQSISYGSINNIIGLTTASLNNGAQYEVRVATDDPTTTPPTPMSFSDVQKTLAHELGHTLGMGHSPDYHDLMYYQSNAMQGDRPSRFLTYGDASTIWTTFTNRFINWFSSRPAITPAGSGFSAPSRRANVRVTAQDGTVICVYRKEH